MTLVRFVVNLNGDGTREPADHRICFDAADDSQATTTLAACHPFVYGECRMELAATYADLFS